MIAEISASERNLAIGERQPSSWTNAHTSPLAPCCLASSVSTSRSERGSSRAPALIPRTTPPEARTSANTLNWVPVSASARSWSSSPKRVSGRSIPYRETASAKVMRGHGGEGTSNPSRSNTAPMTASMPSITSSSSTNAISTSSWVNSGWRSARVSSSRKQRAIW